MVFFFFNKLGKSGESEIVRNAFEKMLFEKLQSEGYCDINPFIGKPRISKSEIESNLKRMGSPLSKLFAGKYAKDTEELGEILAPVLKKMENDKSDSKCRIDEYNYFAIVYFILQTFKSLAEKREFINDLYQNNEYSEIYDIRVANGIVYDSNRVEVNFITSVNQYINFLKEVQNAEGKIFFRGHSKVSYDLKPSLFRKEEWLSNERKMYLELMSKCPFEFERLNSHIEKLAEMQHYGLPTRLLDITQNPLVALYFACESQEAFRGEVILFIQSLDAIKYFQSDTVAVLASLPLFTKGEQIKFYRSSCKAIDKKTFNTEIERLVHEVRMERPGFKSEVIADDVRNVVVCIPAKKNKRLDNQEGAFIVCGLLDEVYGGKKINTLSKLRLKNKDNKAVICIIGKKKELLKELESLGINKAKIYPEIDDVADYIKTHVNVTI